MQHDDPRDRAETFARLMQQECLGTRVSRLHRVIARRYDQALRPLGLSIPQMEILGALVLLDGPARPAQLAEILLAERSTVSRNLAALQERGWVETTTTSAAGRTMAVTATAEGAAVLTAARDTWAALQATAKEQLGPEATQTLDAWLTASA